MNQLAISAHVTAESKRIGRGMFGEVDAMLKEGLAGGPLRDQSAAFAGAILVSLAETTIDFIGREPKKAHAYKRAGFQAFWRAISGAQGKG
jgi:hypothetical protein